MIKAFEDGESIDITTNADMILENKNKSNIAITNQNRDYIKDLNITSVGSIQ